MNIFLEVLKAQKQRKDFALLTVVKTEGSAPRHEGSKMIVFSDGAGIGTIGGGSIEYKAIEDARKALAGTTPVLFTYDLSKESADLSALCGGTVSIFAEIFRARPSLIICGAGHVGIALCKMASMLDFYITVLDNRPEWANKEKLPGAHSIIVNDDITTSIQNLADDDRTAFVIATWGHMKDKQALQSALKKKHFYIGMMGSRAKVKALFNQMEQEGIPRQQLHAVYTPIGLDLKAETPEEIALGTLAEIIMVQNMATGRPLSQIGK